MYSIIKIDTRDRGVPGDVIEFKTLDKAIAYIHFIYERETYNGNYELDGSHIDESECYCIVKYAQHASCWYIRKNKNPDSDFEKYYKKCPRFNREEDRYKVYPR